jgi:Vitamin B12 dependent methionine synthase, activation domain
MVEEFNSNVKGGVSRMPRRRSFRSLKLPVRLDIEEAKAQLRWQDRPGAPLDFPELVREAESLLKPEAAFKVAYIEKLDEDIVKIEGVSFSSRVLRRNLDAVERVFPFVITVGIDLERRAGECGDPLRQYYLESLADMALGKVAQNLESHLKSQHGLSQLSSMSPGSLEDWPITEQKLLFSLFEDAAKPLGVRLTEHMLMVPRKSVSGIMFPTEASFQSCQLCPRKDCPGRRAAFDKELRKKYRLKEEA